MPRVFVWIITNEIDSGHGFKWLHRPRACRSHPASRCTGRAPAPRRARPPVVGHIHQSRVISRITMDPFDTCRSQVSTVLFFGGQSIHIGAPRRTGRWAGRCLRSQFGPPRMSPPATKYFAWWIRTERIILGPQKEFLAARIPRPGPLP